MGADDHQIETVIKQCAKVAPWCRNAGVNLILPNLRTEYPQHTVWLDAYWVDQTDITNSEFKKFVEATGYVTDAEKSNSSQVLNPKLGELSRVPGANWLHPLGQSSNLDGLDNYPVVEVSWNDAFAYCQWAGRRLPTEAEWEKAARGADGRLYPWGNQEPAGNLLNFADKNYGKHDADLTINDGYQYLSPVGNYPDGASPYGVLDMAGNVTQWVNDWLDLNYYSKSPRRNPKGPSSGQYRVVRGSAWMDVLNNLDISHRIPLEQDQDSNLVGFRCATSQ